MEGIRLRWFLDLRSRWQRDLVARLIADGDRAKECCQWDIAAACYRKAIRRYRRAFQRVGGWLTARDGAEVLINLAHSLRERGDVADANRAFCQALALDESFVRERLGSDFILEPINQNDVLGVDQDRIINGPAETEQNPGQDHLNAVIAEPRLAPLPEYWPYRADPPQRYWGKYRQYQEQGGLIRLEEDIPGFVAGEANHGDISRFYFFCLAFDQLMKEGIKGDLAELGVYRGNTASVIATMARRMGTTAWLLDTFEGFNRNDLRGVDSYHQMQFTDTSLEAVRTLVGDHNVRYVKGYFPD